MLEDHVLIRIERVLEKIYHEIRAIRRDVAPHRFSFSLGLYSG